jgi:uridine kinase
VTARVIVLAGPSGAGKTRFANRLGLPILRLDDFYKNGDDPSVRRILTGPNTGMVDWDHPDSWHGKQALIAVLSLCGKGYAEVPYYDIGHDSRSGSHRVELDGASLFVAEGIFAHEIALTLREAGVVAGAFCITQSPTRVFWRRLWRDVRENRKPLPVLISRGRALKRAQPLLVADAVRKGCAAASPREAMVAIRPMLAMAAVPKR